MTISTNDREQFTDAVAVANIPTLLMVLVQMTGDMRWLSPPYCPSRGNGLGDNDSGGLPEDIQTEVRTAALEAMIRWRSVWKSSMTLGSTSASRASVSCHRLTSRS